MFFDISISQLYPHPDNPRKDLGDLTELAESIKANGVLQNLTVVPFRGERDMTSEEYKEACEQYQNNPTEESRSNVNQHTVEAEGYTVIIGHRRLAAAKLAGLTDLPCSVVEMTPQEQIATMLLENIQRSDLTVYEQAQGFQMMLDLGESVGGISEKTGFSETTVRRRVKLLELDAEKFKDACERGATLEDYAELDKIQNIERKNQVLEYIGTNNFEWQLKRAKDADRAEKNKALWKNHLEQYATELDDDESKKNMVYLYGIDYSKSVKNAAIPDDAETVKYFYTASTWGISLYRMKTKEDKESERLNKQHEARKDERRKALDNLSKTMESLRDDFCKAYPGRKKDAAALMAYAIRDRIDTRYSSLDRVELAKLLGKSEKELEVDQYKRPQVEWNDIAAPVEDNPERALLLCLWLNGGHGSLHDYMLQYKRNKPLEAFYDCLTAIGYRMSDDEKAMLDGTHELYTQKESDVEQNEPKE